MAKQSYNEKLEADYEENYGDIPHDYNERLRYMIDKYHVTPYMMDRIIEKKRNMMANMQFYDYMVVEYAVPRIKKRPRMRILRNNYMDAAKINPSMVQVYSPNARDDFNSMHRLIGDELDALHLFIQTPCTIVINAYEKTPTAFSTTDKILAEYGIIPNISHNDYDNMLKSTSDRLNANLWLDDSLVISGTINKLYSILPREEIYIKYLNVAATPYQYHNIINRKTYNTDYPISYLDTSGNMRMD
jgi:Holliday junction resolvase RusA-like endonuclease